MDATYSPMEMVTAENEPLLHDDERDNGEQPLAVTPVEPTVGEANTGRTNSGQGQPLVGIFAMVYGFGSAYALLGGTILISVQHIRGFHINIRDLTEPQKKMPFYLRYSSVLSSTLLGAFILGPPTDKPTESKNPLKLAGKTCYQIYTVIMMSLTMKDDISRSRTYMVEHTIEDESWLAFVLRVAHVYIIVVITGSNMAKIIQFAMLSMGKIERINFTALHETTGEPSFPFTQFPFTQPKTIKHALDAMAISNGPVFKAYGLLTMLHIGPIWAFSWFYLPIALVLYCWLLLPLWACLTFLMKHIILRPLLFFMSSTRQAQDLTFIVFKDDEKEEIQTVFKKMRTSGMLPGGPERLFMWLGRCSRKRDDQIVDEYHKDIDALAKTGMTRDGWFHIVILGTLAIVGFDVIATMMARAFSGEPYLSSAQVTLSERHWYTWLGQFDSTWDTAISLLHSFLYN